MMGAAISSATSTPTTAAVSSARKLLSPNRVRPADYVFDILADALSVMSLDLVGVVCSFVGFPTATPSSTPQLLRSFGSCGDGVQQFNRPCQGVAVSPSHKIWTASLSKILVFNDDFSFAFAASGLWTTAVGVAFADNGDAYIVDCGAHCIHVCRPDGTYVRRVGSPRELQTPCDVAIDSKRELMRVVEYGNNRVSVFKLDGRLVTSWGSEGDAPGQLHGCVAIAVFDKDGKFLRVFGSRGTKNGEFAKPNGIAVDSDHNWLVCDVSNNRVQIFSREGRFITAFGAEMLKGACGVSIDHFGRILIADGSMDWQESRVHVFAFPF